MKHTSGLNLRYLPILLAALLLALPVELASAQSNEHGETDLKAMPMPIIKGVRLDRQAELIPRFAANLPTS